MFTTKLVLFVCTWAAAYGWSIYNVRMSIELNDKAVLDVDTDTKHILNYTVGDTISFYCGMLSTSNQNITWRISHFLSGRDKLYTPPWFNEKRIRYSLAADRIDDGSTISCLARLRMPVTGMHGTVSASLQLVMNQGTPSNSSLAQVQYVPTNSEYNYTCDAPAGAERSEFESGPSTIVREEITNGSASYQTIKKLPGIKSFTSTDADTMLVCVAIRFKEIITVNEINYRSYTRTLYNKIIIKDITTKIEKSICNITANKEQEGLNICGTQINKYVDEDKIFLQFLASTLYQLNDDKRKQLKLELLRGLIKAQEEFHEPLCSSNPQ